MARCPIGRHLGHCPPSPSFVVGRVCRERRRLVATNPMFPSMARVGTENRQAPESFAALMDTFRNKPREPTRRCHSHLLSKRRASNMRTDIVVSMRALFPFLRCVHWDGHVGAGYGIRDKGTSERGISNHTGGRCMESEVAGPGYLCETEGHRKTFQPFIGGL
jgi:hypothetical protein